MEQRAWQKHNQYHGLELFLAWKGRVLCHSYIMNVLATVPMAQWLEQLTGLGLSVAKARDIIRSCMSACIEGCTSWPWPGGATLKANRPNLKR